MAIPANRGQDEIGVLSRAMRQMVARLRRNQVELERNHPGATALFVMLCGGDQNPYPRRELEMCQQHGRALSNGVETALQANLQALVDAGAASVCRAAVATTPAIFQRRIGSPVIRAPPAMPRSTSA